MEKAFTSEMQKESESVKNEGSTQSILIVDDEEDILAELESAFQREGFSTTVAQDGKTALDLVTKNMPDVIITDVRMPKLSGESLLKEIKGKHPKTQPIVFCMSGYTDLTLCDTYKLGVDAYFIKPFSLEEIMGATKSFLKKRQILKDNLFETEVLNEHLREINPIYQLGTMSGALAHELANRVAITAWYIQVAQQQLADLPPDITNKINNTFSKMETNCTSMRNVIESIHMLCTKDGKNNQKGTSEFSKITARHLINDVLAVLTPIIKGFSGKIDIDLDSSNWDLTCICRPEQIAQILINLIKNAIQASTPKSLKEPGQSWVKIDTKTEDGFLEFTVIDCGFTAKVNKNAVSQIFQTSKSNGMGIGLYISKQFAILNNSELYLDDKERHTTFRLRIPCEESKS